ncbi:hypothetical protein T439DRAFT_324034 [Meredithblackwellia eburnea MCA 4105]
MSTQDCADCAPSTPTIEPKTSQSKSGHSSTNSAPIDPNTFSPPILSQGSDGEQLPRVVIEFCDRCRWLHRATWTLTELFLTFPPTSTASESGELTSSGLKAITLLPRSAPETAGRFRVWLYRYRTIEQEFEESVGKESWDGAELVWDRKVEGGFPELKVLKQRIRNLIAPGHHLGHSDKDAFTKSSPVPPSQPPTLSKESSAAPPPEVSEKGQAEEPSEFDYNPRYRC